MSTILSLNIHALRRFVLVWRASGCLFWDISGTLGVIERLGFATGRLQGIGQSVENQRQEEFLQSLARCESQAVKMNPHLISIQNADAQTRGHNGSHSL